MKRLQPFDFKSSPYERPNQPWVCGRKDCGEACALGPDAQGACSATAECQPRKIGDRWFCSRPDARGGQCPAGPRPDGACCLPIPPCTPRRSVRARRGLAVLLVSAFTLGGLLLALALDDGRGHTFFNPGPLTAAHAAGAANCSLCHSANDLISGQPSSSSLAAGAHPDSQLCANCHNFGSHGNEPHSLPRAQLANLAPQAAGSIPLPATSHLEQAGFACATCHQEHHGRDANLKQLTDANCQSCHTRQFESFADGHPAFTAYPYNRRTRIQFDHAGHISNYFPTAAKQGQTPPNRCDDCHATAPDRGLMLTKNFETSCASCHLDGITKPGTKGLAVLGIPGLDKKSLDAKTPGVGHWPADADGELTPFLRYLLAQEPAAAAALATLQTTDLTNLSQASAETAAAATQLAWSLKELMADIITGGHAALQKRLGPAASAAALGQIPADSLKVFTQPDWWPDLLAEVAAHRAGQPPAKPLPPTPAAAPPTPPAVPTNQNPLLGDDLLGDNPRPAPPAPATDLLGGDDLLIGPATPPSSAVPTAPKPPPPLAPEKWASAGGWHLSSADYTLRYRPTGHNDTFLKAWLDLTAATSALPSSPSHAIFNQLATTSSCVKCHSVDAVPAPSPTLLVQWRAAAPSPTVRAFTKFSHGVHFSLLDNKGCQTCHQVAPASPAYNAAFKDNLDPARFVSSFQPLNQAVCAQCHQERGASTSCQTCHNYHVGEFAPASVRGLFSPTAPPAVTH